MIAFGAYRLPPPEGATWRELSRRAEDMLARVLNLGNVVAVVGSGCTREFGYPGWRDFATEALQAVQEGLEAAGPRVSGRGEKRAKLEEYLQELEASKDREMRNESLMFYLGACQTIAKSVQGGPDPFTAYIQKRFGDPPVPEPKKDPCQALAALPIQRFVTTNYDVELERALLKVRRELAGQDARFRLTPSEALKPTVPDAECLSFTQESRWNRNQIRFSLARERGNRNMVFHCHGRFDERSSIIASERDYQRWYVARSEPGGVAFLQTMSILFGSNPLLFVGYGLEEYDLMQILRQVSAGDPERKHSRPIFALLPMTGRSGEGDDEEPVASPRRRDVHYIQALYERYGVHVIPFPRKYDAATGELDLTRALCDYLTGLREFFEAARDEWFQKPPFLKPRAPASGPLFLPKFSERSLRSAQRPPTADRRDEIWKALLERRAARVFGIVGASGTGKTWHALELCRRAGKSRRFDKVFYWNTHYTNEALTAFEILLEYLGGRRPQRASRQEVLLDHLCRGNHLVVVDGCERLLRSSVRSGQGRAYSPGFRLLLRALLEAPLKSRVVLCGRLWPGELGEAVDYPGSRVFKIVLERSVSADLEGLEAFRSLGRADRSALVSLVSGHGYGLLLAGQCLERTRPVSGAGERFREIQRVLASKPPQKRVEAIIRATLTELDTQTGGLGGALLDRLSFFQEPVSKPTLVRCFEDAAPEGSTAEDLDPLLDDLIRYRLMLEVEDLQGCALTYAVHASIRDHLRSAERPSNPLPPDFSLSAFTVVTLGVDPGSRRRIERFEALFETLCEAVEERVEPGQEEQGQMEQARALCRDAFCMLRSETDATAAARWPGSSYDLYLRHGIRLAGLVKVLSTEAQRWSFCDPRELGSLESPDAVLYGGELAWLYNDVGLALFEEGRMQDAFAVWEQGYEINRALEIVEPFGEYVAQSLLNLTHSLLELGKIQDSTEYLEKAARLSLLLEDADYAGRISGYRAFHELLRSNLHESDALYEECLEGVRGNRRALAFFMNQRAQLKLALGQDDAAAALIATSRAHALAGDYCELRAFGRISEGDLQVRRTSLSPTRARHEYETALREGVRLGARALEAFAALELGALSLGQGDAEGARLNTLSALKIANESGLELVGTRALIGLGKAMLCLGEREVGRIYLEVAEQRAARQQYEHRMREAERGLQEGP